MLKVKFISDNNNNPVPFITNSTEDNGTFKPRVGIQENQVPRATSRVENKKEYTIIPIFIFFSLLIGILGTFGIIASANMFPNTILFSASIKPAYTTIPIGNPDKIAVYLNISPEDSTPYGTSIYPFKGNVIESMKITKNGKPLTCYICSPVTISTSDMNNMVSNSLTAQILNSSLTFEIPGTYVLTTTITYLKDPYTKKTHTSTATINVLPGSLACLQCIA